MKPIRHDNCSLDTLVLAFAGIWIVSVMISLLM